MTSIVDALEERDVAIVDIPGAFLQTDMDEVVYMVLQGKLVEALLQYKEINMKSLLLLKTSVKSYM